MTSKRSSWRQNTSLLQQVYYEVKHTSWRQHIFDNLKKFTMTSKSSSWCQKLYHNVKVCHDVKNTSWHQNVRHDVKDMSQKCRHDVTNTSWRLRVRHYVKAKSWRQNVLRQVENMSWRQKARQNTSWRTIVFVPYSHTLCKLDCKLFLRVQCVFATWNKQWMLPCYT